MGIFGPSLDEVWGDFAAIHQYDFTKGSFLKTPRVVNRYKQFEIVMDRYVVSNGKSSTTYTRFRVFVDNELGLSFKLGNRHVFSGIADMLGFRRISSGSAEIDSAYIIKGNDPETVQKIFTDGNLHSLILDVGKIHLSLKKEKLEFLRLGLLKDFHRLERIFLLMRRVLDLYSTCGM